MDKSVWLYLALQGNASSFDSLNLGWYRCPGVHSRAAAPARWARAAPTALPTIAALSVDKPYQNLPTLRMDKSEAL
jgi:hypothetical protein